MSEKDIQQVAHVKKDFQITTTAELETMAKLFVKAGIFAEKNDKNELDIARACVKILAGQELGWKPFQAMRLIDIFQNQISFKYQAVGARVKQSGRYDFKPLEVSDKVARIQFYDRGKEVYLSTFSMEDAQKQGLAHKDNYKKMPADMLYARALTKGVNKVCPEVMLQPAYSEGDFGDIAPDGDVVDAELHEEKMPQPELDPKESAPIVAKKKPTKPAAKPAESPEVVAPPASIPSEQKPSTKDSVESLPPTEKSSQSATKREGLPSESLDKILDAGQAAGWDEDSLNEKLSEMLVDAGVDVDNEEAVLEAFTWEVYDKLLLHVASNKPAEVVFDE